MDRPVDFASSVPDFCRTGKGNHSHRLRDIIMLMVRGRVSGFVGRADIIAFGKYNIKYMAQTVRKTTAIHTREKRLYVSSLPADTLSLGSIVRHVSMSFTRLMRFLCQNEIILIFRKR